MTRTPTCHRCTRAEARVPFGQPEFCIPCAITLAEDTAVVVLAAGCVVCGAAAQVVDGATGDRYCSADATAHLAPVVALRALDAVAS